MRVLYAFPEPLPLPRARGVQVIQAAHALAGQVAALTLAYEAVPGQSDPFAAYGLRRPANVTLLPLSRSLPRPFGWIGVRSHRFFVAGLRQALRRHPHDLAFVRHIKLACALSRARPDLPIAYEAHEVFADTAPARRRDTVAAVEACALHGARLLIANSRATAERLAARYPGTLPAHVLPNGVRLPDTVAARDWAGAGRSILYAGSLFGWKGVEDLVAAAAWLPGCRITIIGGSAEEVARLRASAPAGGAELEFAGRLDHHEVQRRLATAAIAVLPNRADPDSAFTSPLKLFEYLAAGCAVVATDLPAVREVLGDGEAAWAAPGDPRSLAEAIRALVAAPERARATAEAGRRRVLGRSWAARAALLRGLLEPLAAGQP